MNQNITNINRRNFLRLTGITGAGLVVGLSSKANGIETVENLTNALESYELSPFVLIEKSGQITIFNPKPEMGQGTFQSIPALIAEELEVSLDKVTIKQTGGEKKFGPGQSAGGSASVRTSYMNLRKVGASAREMLIKAASQQWNVPVEECF
ncbi:MAG: molybdopterin cofactor-binding domain-containing protein, partial [Bacteroidota bacterium]